MTGDMKRRESNETRMQKWREKARPGESYHVIRGTHDVTGSRHEDIFTFISPATEKLEKQDKFQPKDKSHL